MPPVTNKRRPPREVAQHVRGEIFSGRLQEGSHLTEEALSSRFNVGRATIREALSELSHEGLVIRRPNCGAVVAPEAPKPIRRLIVPVRRAIEAHALLSIIAELDEEDFAHWEQILRRMRAACKAKDLYAVAECDIAFHRYLLERAAQPDLLIIWNALLGRIRSRLHRTQRRVDDLMAIHQEHRQLLEVFRSGDKRKAVKLLKEKIE